MTSEDWSGWLPPLQWGRRSMAAETVARGARAGRGAQLQWGRRSMAAETSQRCARLLEKDFSRFNGAAARWRRRPRRAASSGRRIWSLSMGPPLDGGGDRLHDAAIEHGRLSRRASMGPPLDGGGDARRCIQSGSSRQDQFQLQWGRRSMAAETCDLEPCASMSTWLQWGRRSMAAETVAPRRSAPSRGALQWGRRSMAAETTDAPRAYAGVRSPRFNGAAARWRRRPRRPRRIAHGVGAGLQWGRRSMAAETRGRATRRAVGAGPGFNGAAARWRRRLSASPPPRRDIGGASMGPPLDGGGDRRRSSTTTAPPSTLQWGRRSMAAETAA